MRSDVAGTEDLGAGHGSDLALWLGNPASDYGQATAPGIDDVPYVRLLSRFAVDKDPEWAADEVLALPREQPKRTDARLHRLARSLA